MKYLFLLLFLVGCEAKSCPKEIFNFGDELKITSGFYKGATFNVVSQIKDEYKDPCKVHQYYGLITRGGASVKDYVCQEDLAD